MKDLKLAVAETFYSIQGEGQTIGRPSYFLRLAACNLMCGGRGTEKDGKLHDGATWRCDSIEVWRKGKKLNFEELVDKLGGAEFCHHLACGAHLIVTGGEPLLQQDEVGEFINFLEKRIGASIIVEVETNGTIRPTDLLLAKVAYWNVSPKLANSGEPEIRRFNPEALRVLNKAKGAIFKFVVSNEDDLEEVQQFKSNARLDGQKMWLMPAGSTVEELNSTAPMVAEMCKRHGYSYSHRVHISIWNKKTGV